MPKAWRKALRRLNCATENDPKCLLIYYKRRCLQREGAGNFRMSPIMQRKRRTRAKGPHGRSLFPVSVARSKPRSIATPPWTGCQSIAGLPHSSMSPVPFYTPGRRETKWSKVPCLRKQRDGRVFNTGPPDPEFEVLTVWLHMPPPIMQAD